MMTATMTNVVSYAASPPTTDMNGKRVAVLMHRDYDAVVVAKHGGIIDPVDYDVHDINSGIDKLKNKLYSEGNGAYDYALFLLYE